MWPAGGRSRSSAIETTSWASIATSVTMIAVVSASSYWMYQLVGAYGWDGALRYIWEGDPNPQNVRERIDTLRMINRKLDQKQKSLSSLQEGLERARLDSVDGSSTDEIRKLWEKNIPDKDLRQKLALISYDLDQLAAKIDGVTAGDEDKIKQTKKTMSSRVVKLMEGADSLITAFNSS